MSTTSNIDGVSRTTFNERWPYWGYFTEDPYYRSHWQSWIENWKVWRSCDDGTKSFDQAMDRLARIGCDTDVVLRLAFFEFCHKPRKRNPLSRDAKKQQQVKRWFEQVENRLTQASSLLKRIASVTPLKFVEHNEFQDLNKLVWLVRCDRWTLLDPCDLPSNLELFVLATYVNSFGRGRQYDALIDVLHEVYQAGTLKPPSEEKITKDIQRFEKLRTRKREGLPEQLLDVYSPVPDFIRAFVVGARPWMREEFLAAFPE
jgi:hypothetical protein